MAKERDKVTQEKPMQPPRHPHGPGKHARKHYCTTAAELLTATWDVIPESIQAKLQALGLGPQPQEEPVLTDLLKTHMSALPQEAQAVVTRLTAPIPQTEKNIAQQLKQQVTEMKNQSIRKNQLQTKLDQVKSQYAAMLQDTQDIQTKLNEGQQKLKELSDKYMAAVNQTPKPEELNQEAATARISCNELRRLPD